MVEVSRNFAVKNSKQCAVAIEENAKADSSACLTDMTTLVFRALASQYEHGICPGLLDETEQYFGRHCFAGLAAVPCSDRQVKPACKFRSALVAKEFLADLSESACDLFPDDDSVVGPGYGGFRPGHLLGRRGAFERGC